MQPASGARLTYQPPPALNTPGWPTSQPTTPSSWPISTSSSPGRSPQYYLLRFCLPLAKMMLIQYARLDWR